jgi:hypothetical protein
MGLFGGIFGGDKGAADPSRGIRRRRAKQGRQDGAESTIGGETANG